MIPGDFRPKTRRATRILLNSYFRFLAVVEILVHRRPALACASRCIKHVDWEGAGRVWRSKIFR